MQADPAGPAPRATVLVPLHNHAAFVGPLLHSLFAQWQPGLDLLIIDDGSTDASFAAALAALETRPDIATTLLRNEHPRHHAVAHQVLQHTAARVIIKADSDDIALPGRLEATLDAFETDPGCRLFTSNAVLLTAEGMPTSLYDAHEPDAAIVGPARWAGQPGSTTWLGATMAFDRALLAAFPPIDPELCPYALDMVLPLRATLLGTHRYVARPLVGWRQHGRNAHRAAGMLDPRPHAHERYAALETMVHAQRVRDARHARAASPAERHAAGDAALAGTMDVFLAQYDTWCRLRTRADAAAADPPAPPRTPPVPPIATLPPGRHPLGHTPLGAAAAAWSGFHGPEDGYNWTSATALLVFRTTPAVSRAVLTAAIPPWLAPCRVQLSLNFGPRTEAVFDGTEPVTIELAAPDRWGADALVLLIEAPAARAPSEIDPAAADTRRLGLMLLALEFA